MSDLLIADLPFPPSIVSLSVLNDNPESAPLGHPTQRYAEGKKLVEHS
jgi:hypothetical protein